MSLVAARSDYDSVPGNTRHASLQLQPPPIQMPRFGMGLVPIAIAGTPWTERRFGPPSMPCLRGGATVYAWDFPAVVALVTNSSP